MEVSADQTTPSPTVEEKGKPQKTKIKLSRRMQKMKRMLPALSYV